MEFTKNPVQFRRVVNKAKDWKQGSNPYKQNRYNLRSYKSRATQYLLAQHLYNKQNAMHIYDNNGR